MGNILNNNRTAFDINVCGSDYWDVHLNHSQCGRVVDGLQEGCLSAYIDTTISDCVLSETEIASTETYHWDKAVNKGIVLDDIGLTGIDNGLVTYIKGGITVEEFMELYTGVKLEINEGDLRLHVNKVDGNNAIYSYPSAFVNEDGMNVLKLNGGFFQGFFKTGDGCEYQVLPSELGDGWMVEFTLKPGDFKTNYEIIKEKYSDDEYNSDGWDGHFYIGRDEYSDSYVSDGYTEDNPLPTLNDIYPSNRGIFFYIGTRAENKWWRYYVDSDDETDVETSDGLPVGDIVDTVETDNKFITYNRSVDGLKAFMTDGDGDESVIQMRRNLSTDNYFIVMHRGDGGYTARTVKELRQDSGADYDILGDLYRNAMAFQIRDDGSVGYKYMVMDCDSGTGYGIIEEWSNPGVVRVGEWVTVSVRVVPSVADSAEIHGNDNGADRMRLLFYINGRLVLYGSEIPAVDLRSLDDEYVKQEGVPYNVSIGGGTQGLADVVYGDFDNIPEYTLFLEREFGGSFVGYLKSFKFYSCDQNFVNISESAKHEQTLIHNYL